MQGQHCFARPVDKLPPSVKYLLIGKHPVAVENQDKWCIFKLAKTVMRQMVIKGWRQLHVVSHSIPFSYPLVEEIEGSYREEEWHANTVHHGYVNDVEETCVFEMDDVFTSAIYFLVLGARSCFGLVFIATERIIQFSCQKWDHPSSKKVDVR
jgi:hypothetical protein